MPECRLCGTHFPNRISIDGKVCNLHSRRYCIDCSPYGSHNTKILEKNGALCIICDAPLTGKQTRFCSVTCNNRYKRNNPSKRYKGNSKEYYQNRYKKHLYMAIEYKGNHCTKCKKTYPIECYEFHHLSGKDYQISRMLRYSWANIKHELDKCTLVCGNCHQEIHEELDADINSPKYINNYMNEYHRNNKRLSTEYLGGKCKDCGYKKSIRALAFHHLKDKLFTISSNLSKSFQTLKPELDKCVLLCINCHRIRHTK